MSDANLNTKTDFLGVILSRSFGAVKALDATEIGCEVEAVHKRDRHDSVGLFEGLRKEDELEFELEALKDSSTAI